jgi:hypothetical protein
VRNYHETLAPIVETFAVTNPASLFWALEMWGYGFLGLGIWLASSEFSNSGIERAAKLVFAANGVVSVVGALTTGFYLEWVLCNFKGGCVRVGGTTPNSHLIRARLHAPLHRPV